MHFLIVCLFQICVFFICSIKFFFMFFVQFNSIFLELLIFLLEIYFKFLFSLTHLLFVVADSLLEFPFPFFVVCIYNGLHTLSSLSQALIRYCAILSFLITFFFLSFGCFLRLFGFGFFIFLRLMSLLLLFFFIFFIIILIILILIFIIICLTQFLCLILSMRLSLRLWLRLR
jgi:hypothetical protein